MKLLNATEVASALGVSKARVYALIAENALPVVHIKRQVRVEEESLRAWARQGGTPLDPTQRGTSELHDTRSGGSDGDRRDA